MPRARKNQTFRAYKVSKRLDDDISAVCAAFNLVIENGQVRKARVAFGGMAATPTRARHAEAALAGADLADTASWEPAIAALSTDYTPITDQRAGAHYRSDVARALLRKALVESGGTSTTETRVIGIREIANAGA